MNQILSRPIKCAEMIEHLAIVCENENSIFWPFALGVVLRFYIANLPLGLFGASTGGRSFSRRALLGSRR